MTFKIGDRVQLMSGGPIMTVTKLSKDSDGNPQATCTWFDTSDNAKTGHYPTDALKLYTGEKGEDDAAGDWQTR